MSQLRKNIRMEIAAVPVVLLQRVIGDLERRWGQPLRVPYVTTCSCTRTEVHLCTYTISSPLVHE